MKYLNKFNETCDAIFVDEEIDYEDENVFPFKYSTISDRLLIGKEGSTHCDNNFEGGIHGRIFYDYKVIAIWYIEKYSPEQLKQILDEILEITLKNGKGEILRIKNLKGWCFDVAFEEVFKKDKMDFTYKSYKGQVINNYKVDEETLETWNLYKSKGYHTYVSYDDYLCALIPVEDYLTGDYKAVTNQKAYIKHAYESNFKFSFNDFVNENCDSIEYDCAPDNTTDIDNGYPIAWDLKKDELNLGRYGTMHSDNGVVYAHHGKKYEGLFDSQGRIWLEEKMMAFWDYPTPEKFKRIIDGLEDELDEKIWNNGYQIEIVIKEGEDDTHYGYVDDYNHYFEYKLIPIEEYVGSKKASEKDLMRHLYECHFNDLFEVNIKEIIPLYEDVNESSNIKSFDYVAVKNNYKGEPILYVVDFKVVRDTGEEVECKIKGYEWDEIESKSGKYGFVKVNDFNSNRTHKLGKKDFKIGTSKRKIYDILL